MICGRSVEAWHKNVPNYTSTGGLLPAERVGTPVDDGGQQLDLPQTARISACGNRPKRLIFGRHESQNAGSYQTSKPPQCRRNSAGIATQVDRGPTFGSKSQRASTAVRSGCRRSKPRSIGDAHANAQRPGCVRVSHGRRMAAAGWLKRFGEQPCLCWIEHDLRLLLGCWLSAHNRFRSRMPRNQFG